MKNNTPTHIIDWLKQINLHYSKIKLLAGDASLRQYYRIYCEKKTYILMDVSNQMDSLNPFIEYARMLERHQILVPQIYTIDWNNGWVLLTDLSDRLFLDRLTDNNRDYAYKTAIDILLNLQSCHLSSDIVLSAYDEKIYRQEIDLFRTWYIPYYLQQSLSSNEEQIIDDTFDFMIEHILSHPKVFVHRDYHSRNLIWVNHKQLGVIDFQDACLGSIAYDIVSLLKDCYIQHSNKYIYRWLTYFYQGLNKQRAHIDFSTFIQWFDWVGLQRHLKCLGIFVRLQKKQNKPYYTQHIPTILHYVYDVLPNYRAFHAFHAVFKKLHRGVIVR